MKIGLVGPSYQQRSLPFNAQRTVNLFPVLDEQGKEVSALYGTPGLSLFTAAGNGPIRGCFASSNGRAFVVSGSSLYEIDVNAGVVELGALNTSFGNVSIDENVTQLGICDGQSVYILTFSSNIFAKVTDADLPISSTLTVIDSYFVANKADSGQFYISNVADGTAWDALDFATAESSPDELLRVFNALGQLWLFGDKTTEIWTNTGASAFPFERIAGAKVEVGILAPHSTVAIDNSVFWVGRDNFGDGVVFRARGFTPQRISTEAIEAIIQKAPAKEEIKAWSYQQDGHVFIALTGGGLTTTLIYDISTEQWHERAYLNGDGNYEQHLAYDHMFAFGLHLVGDRKNGNIYQLDLDTYSDNGDEILRERIYTHLSDEGKRIRFSQLEIGFETGVGLQTGQGSDPQVRLQISRDGARTWSDEVMGGIGAVGQYLTRVCFRRLGIARQMTFRIKISDPVKVSICGSYLT